MIVRLASGLWDLREEKSSFKWTIEKMDRVLEAVKHMHADKPHNPLHGVTLEVILQRLVAFYGWSGLGDRIRVNCFNENPSISSSLKFLRKTPWARKKVESLYVFILPDLVQAERVVEEPKD